MNGLLADADEDGVVAEPAEAAAAAAAALGDDDDEEDKLPFGPCRAWFCSSRATPPPSGLPLWLLAGEFDNVPASMLLSLVLVPS